MRKTKKRAFVVPKMCILEMIKRDNNSLPRIARFPAFWCVLFQR